MKKQSFLYGSMILILSAVITKIIGAVFRIPLANMLGGTGMGYFSCAYGIFMPVYAISVTGLPTAVAKLTAENSALELYDNIKKIKRISLTVFGLAGIVCSILVAALAYPFCMFITDNPAALPAVLCIAPTVFFGCITAVYRGYYEGLRNMYPTAVSQVIEGLVKLFTGLGLCYIVLNMANSNPLQFAEIFKISIDDVNDTALPYASAAAILGVTISTFAGTLFLILRDNLSSNNSIHQNSHSNSAAYTDNSRTIINKLLATVIPIAIGSLITNLTSLIDLATIMSSLNKAISSAPEVFSKYLSDNLTLSDLPNFIFGSFTGLAVTVFNLIPSFTNMFGKGALPTLAEGFAAKDMDKVRKAGENVLFTTAFIAVPSGLGICALSRQILELLFPAKSLETEICVLSMSILGLGVVFLCISTAIFSVLQAAGKSSIPVKIMIVGVIVKFFGNIILIPIPEINVAGAAISTLICYIVIFILSIREFIIVTGIDFDVVKNLLFKLFYAGLLCAASAYLMAIITYNMYNLYLSTCISIAIGGIIYIISTHLLSLFTKRSLKMLIS